MGGLQSVFWFLKTIDSWGVEDCDREELLDELEETFEHWEVVVEAETGLFGGSCMWAGAACVWDLRTSFWILWKGVWWGVCTYKGSCMWGRSSIELPFKSFEDNFGGSFLSKSDSDGCSLKGIRGCGWAWFWAGPKKGEKCWGGKGKPWVAGSRGLKRANGLGAPLKWGTAKGWRKELNWEWKRSCNWGGPRDIWPEWTYCSACPLWCSTLFSWSKDIINPCR